MRDRLLSLLVSFAILLSLVPAAGAAEKEEPPVRAAALEDDKTYELENGVELTYNDSGAITGCTLNGQDTVVIPDIIEGVTITSIDRLAFEGHTELVSVTIPDTVTSVGDVAFSGCTGLLTVKLSDTLETIGNNAFYDCRSLTEMALPATLKTIGNYAFHKCAALEALDIPAGVTEVGEGAFTSCSSLTTMTLPAGVTEIKPNLFSGCSGLTSVTILGAITSIGYSAFNSSHITTIDIPETVTEIEHDAFNNCGQLTGVSITGPVTAIEKGTFVNCNSLASVELPNTVTFIGDNAFQNCSALRSITGTENVASIGDSAFKACENLTAIDISNAGVIGPSAFQYCQSLDGVKLSDELSAISDSTFEGCNALSEIVIPDSVQTIGKNAFHICNNLASLTIGTGVSTIGTSAFSSNDMLTEVNLPSNVSVVNDSAFFPCNALETVRVNNSQMTFNGYPFGLSEITNLVMYGYAGSTAEQYAQEHGITFANIEGRTLRVTVKGPDGAAIESGFTVNWYDASDSLVFTGAEYSGADAGITYTAEVVLDETLADTYIQPQRVTVSPSDPADITVTLTAIERIAVTGTVKDGEGKALAGAVVTASTGETATTGSDGTFTLSVKRDAASLTVRLEGYYSRVLELDLSDASGGYDAGEVVMTKTVTDRVVLTVIKAQAVEDGKEKVSRSVPSVETLTVTVTRGGTAVTGFEVQGNSLIFAPDTVQAGDTLTVTVADPAGEYLPGTATVTLDANKTATAELELVQRGSFVLGALVGPEASLLVFNANGAPVYVGLAAAGSVYPAMAAGAYTLVLIQRSNVLRSVPGLAYLDTLGLEEGTDYFKTTVTVADGVVSRVDSVTVPALDESRITYTLAEGTSVSTSKSGGLVQGGLFMLRLAYALDSAKGKTAASLKAVLPEGVEVITPLNVIINGKTVTASYDAASRTLTVPVTAASAVANVYCKAGNDLGMYVVNGYLEFSDGSQQPIGSTAVTVENSGIAAPESTSEKKIVVSGTTSPNSSVTVYDNGEKVGETKSNAAGSWAVSVTLAEPTYNYSYHFLRASVTNETLAEPIMTDETLVTYDERTAQLTKITMINNDDFGERTTVYDFTDETTVQPYYLYAPRFPSFTFKAEFSGDAALSSVYIFSEDAFGVRTYIPTTYDAENDCWVGSHDFINDPPCRIGAVYETDLSQIPEDPRRAEDLDRAYREAVEDMTDELTGALADTFEFKDPTIDGTNVTVRSLTYTDPATGETTDLGGFTVTIDKSFTATAEDLTALGFEALTDELLDDPQEEQAHLFLKMGADTLEAVDTTNHLKITVKSPSAEPQKVILLRMSANDQGTAVVGTTVKYMLALSLGAMVAGVVGVALAVAGVPALIVAAIELGADLVKATWEASMAQAEGIKELKLYALGNYDKLNSELEQVVNAIAARCNDGSPRLDQSSMLRFEEGYKVIRGNVDKYYKECTEIAKAAGERLGGESFTASLVGFCVPADVVSDALSYLMGITSTTASKAQAEIDAKYNRLSSELDQLVHSIQSAYKDCDKPQPQPTGDESPALKTPHGMDPSGYVYEAVPSNRLSGVTAVISSQDGGQWDAGTFDQVNPQVTGADGMYRWDVPEGNWRVDFTREGYEDADTTEVPAAVDGWLPVPPPQLDINIPMVSKAAPEVDLVTAYTAPAQAEIVFSQYMDIDSVKAALSLTRDGNVVEVEVVPLDAEAESGEEGARELATRFAIRPKDGSVEGELKVSVTTGAENYAGKPLAASYTSGAVTAETARPTKIEAAESFRTAPGKTAGVKLALGVPGLALTFESLTPSIAVPDRDGTVTDENGEATLHVTGLLPGTALVKVTEPVSGVSVTVKVIVSTDGPVPEPVTVTLEDGTAVTDGMTIPAGSRIVLKTVTEGAEIRYTLDGSCPCSSDALTYTAPFTITGDTVLRAASVVDGVYSTTVRLSLKLKTTASGGGAVSGPTKPDVNIDVKVESSENGSVTVTPESPKAGDRVTVTVKPDEGYDPGELTVLDGNGSAVELTDNGDGTFTFTQPAGPVTVKAVFVKCPSYAFPDLDGTKWYHRYTDYVLSKGLMHGTSNGLFDPNGTATRAQMVTVLWNMDGNGVVNYLMTYSDVREDAWYAEAVRWASSEKIAGGYGNGAFGPDDLITREQMAAMLYRYAERAGLDMTTTGSLSDFADSDAISGYAKTAMVWAVGAGLLQGKEDHVLDPQGAASRAEVAAVLQRFAALIEK